MDPFGNKHHHHHHRRDDRDDQHYPPPPNFQQPPPFSAGAAGYRDDFQQPPPPFSGGGGGDYRDDFQQPPPPFSGGGGGGYRDEFQPPPFSGGGGGYRDEFQQPPPPFSGGYRNEPPPPFSGEGGGYRDDPPPPHFGGVTGHHHTPPPPHINYGGGEYNPPPPAQPHRSEYTHSTPAHPPAVQHVSHEIHHRPQPHEGGGGNALPNNKPTVRVYSKAETNYSLTIRDGQVILARSDPRDDFQHWIKDEKWSTKVKDKEGHPCFSLINKATGQALKHSAGETYPVQLTPYVPNKFDESILWSFSKDLGDTYNTIRMVNNIKLNLDAFNGDQNHGGVHDGTKAVLWEWKKGDNQRWKIVPY